MDEYAHIPVLLRESLDLLITDPNGTYIDGTIGGGGHTAGILERLSKAGTGRVIGFDADRNAIEECVKRFSHEYGERLILVNRNFSEIGEYAREQHLKETEGVLFDLGVSSFQLDTKAGFSYRSDSPLDMRFQRDKGVPARDIVNEFSTDDLTKLFREFGEEPMSRAIASAIIRARHTRPIETTAQLKDVIASIGGERFLTKRLSRIFQALRIVVNDELGALRIGLESAIGLTKNSGRIAVISYHSLEDRIVKNLFRYEALTCVCPPHSPICTCEKIARVKILTHKALKSSEDEVKRNPRARSAKLRVAEKINDYNRIS